MCKWNNQLSDWYDLKHATDFLPKLFPTLAFHTARDTQQQNFIH